MRAIVVVPTYEERANVSRLIEALLELEDAPAVLIVDDNSPDGTALAVGTYVERYPDRVFLHKRAGKLGLGTAYVEGFRHALALGNFDFILQMDADFSHPPSAIPSLIKRAATADVVVGSRYCVGGSTSSFGPGRLGLSRVAGWLARHMLGIALSDPTGGFKCFRRSALERVDLESLIASGFAFQFEVNLICQKLGLTLAEVPIDFGPRRAGKSKMSLGVVWESCWLILQLRAAQQTPRTVPDLDSPLPALFEFAEPATGKLAP